MNLPKKGLKELLSLSFLIVGASGCATYQNKVATARNALESGSYETALSELKPLAETEDRDQLVYLLDYAVALQVSGNLEESNKNFIKADRLADSLDYHSLSKVAGSLALNQEMVQYKGDTFEKIFINAYLAMNFLEMGKLDDALVEARRINEKYLKYRADEDSQYSLNPFSKYLSAVIWEASRNFDDAYIAFADTYKIAPQTPGLEADLIRTAKLARRMDTYQMWKKKFPHVQESPDWYDSKQAELILIFQQGWGPRKVSLHGNKFPSLQGVYSQTQKARLEIKQKLYPTERVYNVSEAAIKTLREDQAILLAKHVAGLATKAVLSDQVRQKNELLGSLTWIALNVADRADLRQWSTLPESIQIVRVRLPAGSYSVGIQGMDVSGFITSESKNAQSLQLRPGQKKFLVWRSLR